jgi:hypothetical protein
MQQLKELWAKATAPRHYPKWCRVMHQIVWWMNLVNIPLNVFAGAFGWALISLMWCVVFGCFIEQSKNWDKMTNSDNSQN